MLYNRYLNHAKGWRANLTPQPPLMVYGQPRVAFLSARDISAGEELIFDYGVDLEGCLGLPKTSNRWRRKRERENSIVSSPVATPFLSPSPTPAPQNTDPLSGEILQQEEAATPIQPEEERVSREAEGPRRSRKAFFRTFSLKLPKLKWKSKAGSSKVRR